MGKIINGFPYNDMLNYRDAVSSETLLEMLQDWVRSIDKWDIIVPDNCDEVLMESLLEDVYGLADRLDDALGKVLHEMYESRRRYERQASGEGSA